MTKYFRKIIRVTAEESPNVRLYLSQKERGVAITDEVLVPGVLTAEEYRQRLVAWDEIQKQVSLWARFYEGPELKLFPSEWLAHSVRLSAKYRGTQRRAKAMGIDTGEGRANTSWTIVDELGILAQINKKTPDTSVIPRETLGLMRDWNIRADHVGFDLGGGGKQIADRLRDMGHSVRAIPFGEPVVPQPIRHKRPFSDRLELLEEKRAYVNRRAQMYWEFSEACNPSQGGFAIPGELVELLRQLGKIPKGYDDNGRAYLMPKQNKDPDSKRPDLIKLIGHSPDEADSAVLAYHIMLHERRPVLAGVQ